MPFWNGAVKYPDERDITNPAPTLPQEVAAELAPLVEQAQRRYRRFRQNSGDYRQEPEIVLDHAADVFKTLAVRELRSHDGSFDDFHGKMGLETGAADTAFRYAHHLYNSVQGGRMLAIWHGQIRKRLLLLIRDAEDLWWDPEIVPKGWERFIGTNGPSTAPPEVSNTPAAHTQTETSQPARPAVAEMEPADGNAEEAQSPPESGNAERENRRAMVDAFIEKCRVETTLKVNRAMIWRVVGYKQRSEFERWQSNSPKATRKAAKTFARVLSMQPRDFVDLLRKRQVLKKG